MKRYHNDVLEKSKILIETSDTSKATLKNSSGNILGIASPEDLKPYCKDPDYVALILWAIINKRVVKL
jgi:hypothetical protein